MRYREFKLFEAEPAENTSRQRVVVGDSHGVAIKTAGNFAGSPENGANVARIAQQVSSVPNGSAVILSAGNNDITRAPGQVADGVQRIVDALKAKDCTVTLVLFPPIQLDGPFASTYRQAGYTANYNAVRNALGRVNCDGKLELTTADINPGDPMKIHAKREAYARIARVFALGTGGADSAAQPAPEGAAAAGIEVPNMLSAEDLQSITLSSPDNSFFGLFNQLNAEINYDPEDVQRQVDWLSGGSTVGAGGAGVDTAGGAAAARGAATTPSRAINGVLDFIARYESSGDYNLRNGGSRANLIGMTIAEIFEMQRNYRTWPGATSTAVGRYQYIKDTLEEMVRIMGLNPATTRFDQRTQDSIATTDLRRRCRLDDWLAGRITDGDFMNLVSRVWAGIPNTGGRSTYAGVGNNRAGTTASGALGQLAAIRTGGTGTATA